MRQITCAILICLLADTCLAKDAKPKTVAEAMERASKLSQLTTPGSVPFHLKATISEPDSTDSDYKAEIEEHWLAPDKWRQTIKTPDFSQTLIVNGEKISEQNQGDYYPLWLRDLVTAIFDLAPTRIKQLQTPLPDLAALQEHGAQNLPPALRNFRIDTGTSCDRSKEEVVFDRQMCQELLDELKYERQSRIALLRDTHEELLEASVLLAK